MRTRALFLASYLGVLAVAIGCATPYQPKGLAGGFSDRRLDADTFHVEFQGNGYTSRQMVETYLLRRAAEITVTNGFDYFVVLGGDTESRPFSHTTPGTYSATTTGSATVYGRTAYGSATTVGTYTPGQTIHFTKYGATAVVKAFRGEKPSPAAFNAREMLQYLGPTINPGGEPLRSAAVLAAPAATNEPVQQSKRPASGLLVGTYRGTVSGDTSGRPLSMRVTLTIVQDGSAVTGTWTTTAGTSGTITGTITAPDRFSFRAKQVQPCAGDFDGVATIGENAGVLGGSYTGRGCTGSVNASFTAVRE